MINKIQISCVSFKYISDGTMMQLRLVYEIFTKTSSLIKFITKKYI